MRNRLPQILLNPRISIVPRLKPTPTPRQIPKQQTLLNSPLPTKLTSLRQRRYGDRRMANTRHSLGSLQDQPTPERRVETGRDGQGDVVDEVDEVPVFLII